MKAKPINMHFLCKTLDGKMHADLSLSPQISQMCNVILSTIDIRVC